MKSMTGHGRGECAQDGWKITVEASSVNRRQGEVAVSLPRELDALESRIRDEVNRHVARGRVALRVTLHAADGASAPRARLNTALAGAYHREFLGLARRLKLEPVVPLDTVLRAPGVLQAEDTLSDADEFWPAVAKALGKAVAALVKMREREGNHLQKDLKERVALLRRSVDRVQKRAPEALQRHIANLRERVRAAGLELPAGTDERLLKEIVYYSDRSDISEELTRLQSHFQQFEDCLRSKEPVGRTLDFLAQEMNREVNTIGSKANDADISREVVTLKTEVERFREQVQNVE